MQVWHFSSGAPTQVLAEEHGLFSPDQAYVVLAEVGETPKIYLWAGADAPKDTLATAAKHASELKETMDASYLRQQQGHEAAEFKQLFPKFEIRLAAVAAAAPAEAAPKPSSESVTADGEGGGEEAEEEEQEEQESASAAATAGKKKKRKNKKKSSQQQEAVAEPAAPSPTASPAKQQQAAPASPTLSVGAAAFSPASAAKPASPPAAAANASAAPAAAKTASPPPAAAKASPPPPPVATKEASPLPVATKEAAPDPSSPKISLVFAPAKVSVVVEPPKASESSPPANTASPAPAAAMAATAAAAPRPAPPAASKAPPAQTTPAAKGTVDNVGVESVSKSKQQLMDRLGGTMADPLAQKKQNKDATKGGKASTYLADSAKAWGGVNNGDGTPKAAQAKVKPGDKSFGYEELKNMRVESGIDMASKESYLSESEFEKVFGKNRAAFKAMPAWRQQMAKKQVGLW